MLEPAFARSATFDSFFLGGFECSTHRGRGKVRLDLLKATRHDETAASDYEQLSAFGLKTFRDGVRWHLIEKRPGHYDWSSFLAMLRAANNVGVQVIWDLFHYGWPNHLDIFDPSFIGRFERFSAAVARIIQSESDAIPFYCPVNEISYFAWAAGEKRLMHPFRSGEGGRLKQQLVRASIAAIEAVRSVDSRARFVHAEPAVHVTADTNRDENAAREYNGYQFEAMDMVSGRLHPELGGDPKYLDLLGLNYYCGNQWFFNGGMIPMGHYRYRALRELLCEIHARYQRPLFIAETGAEGGGRAPWLHYITAEVIAAKSAGANIEGICLYPVTDYPGWENNRLCQTGLLGVPDVSGRRQLFQPLLDQLISSAASIKDRAR